MKIIEDSIVVKKADELAHSAYRVTRNFPKSELYGLTSQLRRAALSVPINVIEGFARQSKAEYRHFLKISYGSLKEASYLVDFSYKEKLMPTKNARELSGLTDEIGGILWKLINK